MTQVHPSTYGQPPAPQYGFSPQFYQPQLQQHPAQIELQNAQQYPAYTQQYPTYPQECPTQPQLYPTDAHMYHAQPQNTQLPVYAPASVGPLSGAPESTSPGTVAVKSSKLSLGAKVAIGLAVALVLVVAVGIGVGIAVISNNSNKVTDYFLDVSTASIPHLCGETTLNNSTGEISSMNYDGSTLYDANAYCTWLIRVDIGQVISLSFTAFELQWGLRQDYYNFLCAYDAVTIFDGEDNTAPLLASLCGQDLPSPVVSSSNTMFIIFYSDGSESYTGFQASYMASDMSVGFSGCGGDYYLSGSSGTVTSMNFDGGFSTYAMNAQCEWLIEVASNKLIELTFNYFDLEYHSVCAYDILSIYDGPTVYHSAFGHFCGPELPETEISSSNKVYMQFTTDAQRQLGGFSLDYAAVGYTGVSSNCGGDRYLSAGSGTISSMNYDGSTLYDSSSICEWVIQANTGEIVELTFTAMDIEDATGCGYDYVILFDGDATSTSEIIKYCGYSLPSSSFASTGTTMYIKFLTDHVIEYTGFQATYTAVGQCTPSEFRCVSGDSCISASLVCDSNNDCPDNSDETGCSSDTCGASESFTGASDTFSSPGYDGTSLYAHNLNCEWVITVDTAKKIMLYFTDFKIQYSSPCSNDFIAVYDGPSTSDTLIGKYCGDLPSAVYSSGNQMAVTMVTDGSITDIGFLAGYEDEVVCTSDQFQCGTGEMSLCINDVLHCDNNVDCDDGSDEDGCPGASPCGGPATFTSDSGSFSSMNYDGTTLYDSNAACYWQITVTVGKIVFLSFNSFDLESSSTCDYDAVSVYNGADDSATNLLLGKYCGRTIPPSIRSTDNQMYVTFTSDISVQYTGFEAEFVAEVACSDDEFRCGNGTLAVCVSSSLRCNGIEDCNDSSDESGCPGNQANCGVPAYMPTLRRRKRGIPNSNQRIVGGVEADIGSWPWQISLEHNDYGHICGGTIINTEWIVTAAHCVVDDLTSSMYTIVAGEHDRGTSDSSQQSRSISTIVVHDSYNSFTLDYDIALLKVSTSLSWTNYVIPACLEVGGHTFSDGKICYITGWGDTLGTGDNTYLYQVDVPLLSNTVCNQPSYLNGRITDRMMCAGYDEGGKDSCQGDSGGPLVCEDSDDRWYLAGIVSWGFGCADPMSPGVYARTSYFTEWISQGLLDN
ncbi:suppressor of tumorigenicity 14 protein homolog [Saccoglossus kowalevskii]|uniref:Tolloid-like protein 2-like n=1 Tax=Saccoglossus kowalevskii TaxID=10224 RepID=A0ABM0MYK0_SACKO|nr:PREDICTED: tolloid-like protein 2-like [Saccoglossus kowalevskii]